MYRVNKFFILNIVFALSLILIGCEEDTLHVTSYIDNSKVRVDFNDDIMKVYHKKLLIYSAKQIEQKGKEATFEIDSIIEDTTYKMFSPKWIEKGKTIKLLFDDRFPLSKKFTANISADGFGSFDYNFSGIEQDYEDVEIVCLREVEKKQFQSGNPKKLTDYFNIQLSNKGGSADVSILNNIFMNSKENIIVQNSDDNSRKKSSIIIKSNFMNKIGAEIFINQNSDDTENGYTYSNDKDKLPLPSVRAILVDIPKEYYFRDMRPKTITVYFSITGRKNPAYNSYIYEKKAVLELKDQPGEHVFYLMRDVDSVYSLSVKIDNFYEGLTDKVIMRSIDFYIK